MMDERTKHPHGRRRLDRLLRPGWFMAAVAAIVIGVWVQSCGIASNTKRLDRQQQGLALAQRAIRQAQKDTCRGIDTLRGNDNRNAELLYELATIASQITDKPTPAQRQKLDALLARLEPTTAGVLAILITPEPGLADRFRRAAQRIGYVPRTDCGTRGAKESVLRPPPPRPVHSLSAEQRRRLRTEGFPDAD